MNVAQQKIFALASMLYAQNPDWLNDVATCIAESDTFSDIEKCCIVAAIKKVPTIPYLFETLLYNDFENLNFPANLTPIVDMALRVDQL